MVIKVCLSIFCYDRNIRQDDRNIYGSHQNNELSQFEEHVSCCKLQNIVFICCIKVLIKFI